jgi:hypothetical protein
MSDPLTETQVARIVAEVTRQSQLRDIDRTDLLERQQVVQILEELKLPVDLLDPAIQELERRREAEQVQKRYDEALAKARRQKVLIVAIAVVLLLALVLGVGTYFRRRNAAFSEITSVGSGRITRGTDDGGSLSSITRDGSDAIFRVTLDRVPPSENLNLKCNWIDPAGRIVKQNSWQSKTTDKTIWTTSCRNTFGAAAPSGKWQVEMLLDDRPISRTDFQVE